jgi:SAM-dependent methyltransferase
MSKVNKFFLQCFSSKTELCEIAAKYESDKSPYNYGGIKYRHSYTPFYSMLFSNFRENEIIIGEVGILYNASIKAWREYFPNAEIYAWDGSYASIDSAKRDNLKNVHYDYMHTGYEESITDAFSKIEVKFDVLIDDASHLFWDQIRFIRRCSNYLKPGGILIIEDINEDYSESDYIAEINRYGHERYYNDISFVEFDHSNKEIEDHHNDKIIYMTKNNFFTEK